MVSFTQVGTVQLKGTAASPRSRQVRITIPKILVCSQMPVGTIYPLDVTLTVCEGVSEGGIAGERAHQPYTPLHKSIQSGACICTSGWCRCSVEMHLMQLGPNF